MLSLSYVPRISKLPLQSSLGLSNARLQTQPCRSREISRHLHARTDSGPFNVLFFGRDEFSCTVIKQLHAAKGRYNLVLKWCPDEGD